MITKRISVNGGGVHFECSRLNNKSCTAAAPDYFPSGFTIFGTSMFDDGYEIVLVRLQMTIFVIGIRRISYVILFRITFVFIILAKILGFAR